MRYSHNTGTERESEGAVPKGRYKSQIERGSWLKGYEAEGRYNARPYQGNLRLERNYLAWVWLDGQPLLRLGIHLQPTLQ